MWDGGQIVLELDGTGAVTNKYVRGINLLYAEDGTGARKYYLFNGHGDVVQLTGIDGNVTKTYDYDAFGNEKDSDPNDTNVFRYCGEYFDKETGTIYLRARYYDPATSRMLTEDNYWGDPKDPLSLNLYTYCKNNPIIYIDPSGYSLTEADRNNLSLGNQVKMLWYTANYEIAKVNLSVPWLEDSKDNYYAEMNYWHKKAVELRRTYDADYVDDYDYTYGGTYSGFTISDEAMEENAKIAFDAFALTTAGTSRVAVKAPSTVTKATTVVPKASSRIKVNLQLFAKKSDIKQIESIAKADRPPLFGEFDL